MPRVNYKHPHRRKKKAGGLQKRITARVSSILGNQNPPGQQESVVKLVDLAACIYGKIGRSQEDRVVEKIKLGACLGMLKQCVGHGYWLNAINARCPGLTARSAQRYILTANQFIPPHLKNDTLSFLDRIDSIEFKKQIQARINHRNLTAIYRDAGIIKITSHPPALQRFDQVTILLDDIASIIKQKALIDSSAAPKAEQLLARIAQFRETVTEAIQFIRQSK